MSWIGETEHSPRRPFFWPPSHRKDPKENRQPGLLTTEAVVEFEARLARQRDLKQEAFIVVGSSRAYSHDIANADVPLIHPRHNQVLAKSAGSEARRGPWELALPRGIVRAAIYDLVSTWNLGGEEANLQAWTALSTPPWNYRVCSGVSPPGASVFRGWWYGRCSHAHPRRCPRP